MRILEAWARGLPVIATPAAAAGLAARHGEQLLIAADGESFAQATQQLVEDTALRQRLVLAGRAYLQQQHDRSVQTRLLLDHYEQARCAR